MSAPPAAKLDAAVQRPETAPMPAPETRRRADLARRCGVRLRLAALAALLALPNATDAAAGDIATATASRAEALAATRGIRPRQRAFPDCPPLGATLTEWRDARGMVRRAVLDHGSEDSAFRAEMFRDAAGRPRVVFISGGAVNGARLAHRILFAPDGRRLREARSVSEPGYTFPNPWPAAFLPRLRSPAGRCPWPEESPQ